MTPFQESATAKTYAVSGMTCNHCAASVTDEVSAVACVERVDVDLTTGQVVVESENVSAEAVRTAVVAAGYEVTS